MAFALPVPWLIKDIGGPLPATSDSYAAGLFSLLGSGAGVAGTNDQFHFVYQAIQGNADLIVQVLGVFSPGDIGTTGIMVRDSLEANAAIAFVGVTSERQVSFRYRTFAGGAAGASPASGASGPLWLRLVRSGDLFTAYRSADRNTWVALGSQTIVMASRIYVGLPVSSGQSAYLATAVLADLTLGRDAVAGGDGPPVVDIASPAHGASFQGQQAITIRANVHDPDGTIARVDFFADGILLGSASTAPYEVSWSATGTGNYTLTARAVDNAGGVAMSAPVPISVVLGDTSTSGEPAPPPPPSVPYHPFELVFVPSPDHDAIVTSYVLDVHRGGDPPTASPWISASLGKPDVWNGVIEMNIDSIINAVPDGDYYVVVRALAAGGASPDAVSPLLSK